MVIDTQCDTWCQPIGGILVRNDYDGGFWNDCDYSAGTEDKFAVCESRSEYCYTHWETGDFVCDENCDTFCVPFGGFLETEEYDGGSYQNCVFDNIDNFQDGMGP